MRNNTIITIGVVIALMIGAVMLYATAGLLSEMNPDPHNHSNEYALSITREGIETEGKASSSPFKENDSFYNYKFTIETQYSDVIQSFVLLFDSNEMPHGYEYVGTKMVDGTSLKEYESFLDGLHYTILVGDYCIVHSFSITDPDYSVMGTITA